MEAASGIPWKGRQEGERRSTHRTSFIGFRKPLCWGSGPGFSPRDDATLRNKVCARENYSQAMQMAMQPKALGSKHTGAHPGPASPPRPPFMPPRILHFMLPACSKRDHGFRQNDGPYDTEKEVKGGFKVLQKSQLIL